jgi:cell division transport system ATP-binding protein
MLKFEDVSFSYNSKDIFSGINCFIERGEFVFIVGESGIGKTTFMKLIYHDEKPKSGSVIFDEYESGKLDKTDIPYLRRKIGIIFQDFKLLNDRNIFENIALPLYIEGQNPELIRKRVYDCALKVGLMDKINNMPYDLSGGEKQRVAIARAIVNDPLLILADEPTGNLDPFIAVEILKILTDINYLGTSVIFSTHNFEIVRRMKEKRILQIKENKLFEVKMKG